MREYSVGVSGESFYQEAIARCRLGDVVHLLHEPDNPYDDRAIAVLSRREKIGHLPRDGWLTDAIIDEGATVSAKIRSLNKVAGNIAVVLKVSL